ncbi:unnamed protein product [Brachionus calyciflorus]|uniref:Uncharacterized protein n=1 Tax=Brachionus calyciflorus TaxID=104777 RepID=A0A813UGP7_9BILA|nr:unnamed protein product [Brachionus calyciflorus]
MEINLKILISSILTLITLYFIIYTVLKFVLVYIKKIRREKYPKNVVILHQFYYDENRPSLSVPCLKLETWLRVTGINYINEFTYLNRSSQGQLPFITLNNIEYHDSQFIIEHLSKVYEKNLTEQLSKKDKAIGRAILKLLEESLKWTIYYHRFMVGKPFHIGIPWILVKTIFKPIIKKSLFLQGYGRHSPEEVYHIGKQDLQALEDFPDGKRYLFGDTICNEDVVLFSFIAQLIYYDKGVLNNFLIENCSGLINHFNLIKNQYWPEWNNFK